MRGLFARAVVFTLTLLFLASGLPSAANDSRFKSHNGEAAIKQAALYPEDKRRQMTEEDYLRYPGAGVLFCRDDEGVPRRAATSWLIGNSRLVMMNAHNFVSRDAEPTRSIESCFFQIGGRNYNFSSDGFILGIAQGSAHLHITDDWALAELEHAVDPNISPQRIPAVSTLMTGRVRIDVVMVSPAGHANFAAQTSIESCQVRAVDPPSEDDMRRVRHNCNDGYGGSGSGLFDEAGHLLAMQSASLDMNRRLAFDIERHYGSAILIEGQLLHALIKSAKELQP